MLRLPVFLIGALTVALSISIFLPTVGRRPFPIEPPVATSPAAFACTCDYDRFNCDRFETQEDAQGCFQYCINEGAGDIHKLDGDNDGVACEDLPAGFRVVR